MTEALCKIAGGLYLCATKPSDGPGHCPVCRGTEFADAPYGWVECTQCRNFAVLRTHLDRAHRELKGRRELIG
jgi:rubredoxin